MQHLTVRSLTDAVSMAWAIGGPWMESVNEPDRVVIVYRDGQPFAIIRAITNLDNAILNQRAADQARYLAAKAAPADDRAPSYTEWMAALMGTR